MSRTTKTQVRYVLETALEDDEIDALIDHASAMVTSVLGNEGLDSDLLLRIETYLTAHLIAIGKERQPIKERVGDIELQFHKMGGSGFLSFLEQTTFGQAVLFMDTRGLFQKISSKRAFITAIKQNNDD